MDWCRNVGEKHKTFLERENRFRKLKTSDFFGIKFRCFALKVRMFASKKSDVFIFRNAVHLQSNTTRWQGGGPEQGEIYDHKKAQVPLEEDLCLCIYIGLFYKLVYYLIRECSYAWPLFKLSLVSFSPLNTYIARYARVRRTEIYCAIARKLSQANL